jgi:FkbM family methyltransferase
MKNIEIKENLIDLLKDYIRIKFVDSHFKEFQNERGSRFATWINERMSNEMTFNIYYERRLLDAIKEFLHLKDISLIDKTVLDVGSNVGNHAIYFSKISKKIICFEPEDLNYKILEINTSFDKNKFECKNFGLSDENKEFLLYLNTFNSGNNSISEEKINGDNLMVPQKIKVRRLDDLELTEEIGLIKIDVEGLETNVIKGGIKTILKNKPVILFESNKNEFTNGTTSTIEYLKTINYSVFSYERKYNHRSLFVKRIVNLKEIFFGRIYEFKKQNKFKHQHYNLLVALPN